MSKIILSDVQTELVSSGEALAIKREQEIPGWYLQQLSDSYIESKNAPAGDFHRIASIPVAIVEHMQREGIDPYKASIAEIVKWLKNHDCGKLLTSSKSIG